MTSEERLSWYLKKTTGRGNLIQGLAWSGFATLRKHPEAWNRDLDGFGQRVASRQARVTINNSVQLGLGFLLKDDPRYYRAPEKGVGGRIKNAVISSFTVRNSTGGRMPAYSRFAGIGVSNMATKMWMPPGHNSWGDVGARTGSQIGFQIGTNLLKEFWPDLKRKFRN